MFMWMRLYGPVAAHLHAVHEALKLPDVVDRDMHGAAVVPDRDRAGLPAEAAGELGARRVPPEELEQRRALLGRHPGETLRVGPIDEQRLAAGFGMRAHDRMLGYGLAPARILAHLVRAVLVAGGLRPRNGDVSMNGCQARYQRLHTIGQRLVGEILRSEEHTSELQSQ